MTRRTRRRRTRQEEAEEEEEEQEEEEQEEEATDIKSNNPHLAGGEKTESPDFPTPRLRWLIAAVSNFLSAKAS